MARDATRMNDPILKYNDSEARRHPLMGFPRTQQYANEVLELILKCNEKKYGYEDSTSLLLYFTVWSVHLIGLVLRE